jgi:hypothetical protein
MSYELFPLLFCICRVRGGKRVQENFVSSDFVVIESLFMRA